MMSFRLERDRALIALAYFTRVPIPDWVPWSPDHLAGASRYFPLIGLFVGASVAAVLWGAAQVLPASVAVLLSMGFSLMLTGAFHEDGLADSVDGLGGGYTPGRALEIMKDSRIGTFGAAALMLSLALKAALLIALVDASLALAMVALCLAHAASRWMPVELMARMHYVRDADQARAKPVADHVASADLAVARASTLAVALLAWAAGWMPFAALLGGAGALLLLGSVILRYLQHRIGGYTGDTLGASQQLAELTLLLIWVAVLLE